MTRGSVRLDWRGPQALAAVVDWVVKPALADWALYKVEKTAKEKLQKGHGVITGTLRRSIHGASPGYAWDSDNVEPGAGTPERGGTRAEPAESGGRIVLELGSGMEYALSVHQGHGSFPGYHYLVDAANEEAGSLDGYLKKYSGNLQ